MHHNSSKELIINGVRYLVTIRLDTQWSYIDEWSSRVENRRRSPDDSVRSAYDAEQEATDEIYRARLRKEPWLHAEVAGTERKERDSETESA